jgi:hypothetical protein
MHHVAAACVQARGASQMHVTLPGRKNTQHIPSITLAAKARILQEARPTLITPARCAERLDGDRPPTLRHRLLVVDDCHCFSAVDREQWHRPGLGLIYLPSPQRPPPIAPPTRESPRLQTPPDPRHIIKKWTTGSRRRGSGRLKHIVCCWSRLAAEADQALSQRDRPLLQQQHHFSTPSTTSLRYALGKARQAQAGAKRAPSAAALEHVSRASSTHRRLDHIVRVSRQETSSIVSPQQRRNGKLARQTGRVHG